MLLEQLRLTNLLSFGPNGMSLKLQGLNVLIGPNGSGKSNLIEAVSLLKSAATLLAAPVKDGGGIHDWLYKGRQNPVAALEAVVSNPHGRQSLRHVMSFTESMKRFELVDERVENEKPYEGQDGVYFYYRYQKNQPVLNVKGKKRVLLRENIDPEQSILSQRKDPDQYPEISYLGLEYAKIRIYREWGFGRYTAPRLPQPADRRNDFLEEDCENLGMVLNRLRGNPSVKKTILDGLKRLYDGIDDFEVNVVGGTVQVSVHEGKFAIPATRLSDGTLRYLCLLAILCDPSPPPLICIEEPELGLHPDALTGVADLLKIAAERTQIIVTTHSEILVDEMTDCPESVIVCSKTEGATEMKRLEKKQLEGFLDAYRLGKRWMQGQVGGVRW